MKKEVLNALINEYKELNDKTTNLRNYLLGDKVTEDSLNKDLLIGQLKAMETYLTILSVRIGLNAKPDTPENVESSVVSE